MNTAIHAERIALYLRLMKFNALIRRTEDAEIIDVTLSSTPGRPPSTLATIIVNAHQCVVSAQGTEQELDWVAALHVVGALAGKAVPRVLSDLGNNSP